MDANAHTSLGKVLYELGRYEESRDIYRQAIYLDSSKSQAYHEQREALLTKGRLSMNLGVLKMLLQPMNNQSALTLI